MNVRLLSCFFVTVVSFNVKSQFGIPVYYDTLQKKQEINIYIYGEYATSSVSNTMLNKFLFGGEISETLVNENLDKHKINNRAGFYTNPTIEYINYCIQPFKKKEWGLITKAGLLYSGFSRYSKELFGLVFRGNEDFLGHKIALDNTLFTSIEAQKIGIGLIDSKTKSSVTLNFYGITNYTNSWIKNGYFSQDEYGFNAELGIHGSFEKSLKKNFYKGYGIGLDANLFFNIGTEEKPTFFHASIENFGFAVLKNSTSRHSMDTTLHFNGFKVSEIINKETFLNENENISKSLGIKNDTISYLRTLPFTLQLSKIIDEHNKKAFQFYYGGRIYIQNGTVPMVYLGTQYKSKSWFRVGTGVSFGGFTGFRVNMYTQAVWNSFNIGVATNDLIGAFGLGKGQSFTLNISKRF